MIDKSSEFYEWYMGAHARKKKFDENAAIYARYSSHSQGEQSIEGQIAAARKYAEAKGYTVVHEYIDRAMTGKNDNRDEFQRMLSDCAKKQFSVIIVWKVDRFGRNREEITFNKHRAKAHGVRVEYVAENLPESPEAVILESVLEGMAEYYSIQLSQNIRRGLTESAKKHQVLRKPPLGYRASADRKFEIDPDTAPIVQLIFTKYAEGYTMKEVADYLNENGYRTSRGNPFTKNGLPRILSCENYIGVYTYKDLREEDVIPPIIDKELFARVQEMLKTNRRMPSHKWSYTDFILTGKLFCGSCGAAMAGESGFGKQKVKYSYYACTGRKREYNGCKKRPVRQDRIEDIVLREIQSLLRDDEMLDWIADHTWEFYLKQDEAQENLRNAKAQLLETQKGITNLVRSLEAGIINDAITARMDELGAQETALKKAISEIELAGGIKLTRDHIRYFLEQFRNLDAEDRDSQRRLVEIFVNAIFVYDDHLTLTFNFGGDKTTIALSDALAGESGEGFVCCAPCSTTPCLKMPVFRQVFC